ncbi:hypothetical protein [Salibacterium aidingense]|uniref:hypothetical protein n=1 Tax=Salibacterium aidingense TaxID=384933 RepID=UPI003BEADF8E
MLESSSWIGQSVDIFYYLSLALVAISLATCIGAIGAGLEDEEKVLQGTYSYRQLRRKQQVKQQVKEKENKEIR